VRVLLVLYYQGSLKNTFDRFQKAFFFQTSGVRFLGGGGTVVIDNLICEGLKACTVNHDSHVTINNSLLLDNDEAIQSSEYQSQLEIQSSFSSRNECGVECRDCRVETSLFLQNRLL